MEGTCSFDTRAEETLNQWSTRVRPPVSPIVHRFVTCKSVSCAALAEYWYMRGTPDPPALAWWEVLVRHRKGARGTPFPCAASVNSVPLGVLVAGRVLRTSTSYAVLRHHIAPI